MAAKKTNKTEEKLEENIEEKETPKKADSPAKPKSKDTEKIIEKLSGEGKTPSQIGMVLRDTYGIGDVKESTGKKINAILKERGITTELPEDLSALISKATVIKAHMDTHKKDMSAKYGLQNMESNIRRLGKYYVRKNVLPANWKYKN